MCSTHHTKGCSQSDKEFLVAGSFRKLDRLGHPLEDIIQLGRKQRVFVGKPADTSSDFCMDQLFHVMLILGFLSSQMAQHFGYLPVVAIHLGSHGLHVFLHIFETLVHFGFDGLNLLQSGHGGQTITVRRPSILFLMLAVDDATANAYSTLSYGTAKCKNKFAVRLGQLSAVAFQGGLAIGGGHIAGQQQSAAFAAFGSFLSSKTTTTSCTRHVTHKAPHAGLFTLPFQAFVFFLVATIQLLDIVIGLGIVGNIK
mmetsp:Transcript_81200/g.99506  ORF Transcript_81200/g.99506 Transcript_81200/m.99506 type:complete len:255 (-) Transcript_81200:139-903(-)